MLYEIYVALAIITLVLNAYTLVYFVTRDRDNKFFMLIIASMFFNIITAASSVNIQKITSAGIVYVNQLALMKLFALFFIADLVYLIYYSVKYYLFKVIDDF